MNFDAAVRAVYDGVKSGAAPCAAFAIGRGNEVFVSDAVGYRAYNPEKIPVSRDTRFDLASLSKVVSTTTVALRMIEEGRLLLTDTLSDYFTSEELEGAPDGRAGVTVFRLMTHSSGITPHVMLERFLDAPDDSRVANVILSSAPFCRPGEQVYYSCMGYILLQKILERLSGKPLDVLASEYVFGPLGMKNTGYVPGPGNADYAPAGPDDGGFALTEYSKTRGTWICGRVHDENAYFLGGVSGNAGVFTTLDDMIAFSQMCATRGENPRTGKPFLARSTFDTATVNYTPGLDEARGLGFQLKPPLPGSCACADLMSVGSYGHTGFTGTSLYVDPRDGFWGLLLTNAVHLGRENKGGYFRMRRQFYNAARAGADR